MSPDVRLLHALASGIHGSYPELFQSGREGRDPLLVTDFSGGGLIEGPSVDIGLYGG